MAVVNGTNNGEILNGTVGNDTINGFAGNDIIFGDTGRDVVNGGNGDDRFDITAQAQIVTGETYKGGLGTDRLYLNTSSLINLSSLTIGTDVEQLVSNGSVALKSSQLGNFNYVQTQDITLTNGGLVDLSDATVWTREFTLNNAGNIFDLTGVNNTSYTVNGADGADTIIGSDNGDALNGGGRDDTLVGGAGNDIIFGDVGRDIVDGGSGDDRFDITAQVQIIASESYKGGTGTDRLYLNTASLINLSPLIISADVEQLVANGSVSLKSSQLGNFNYVQTGAITLTNGGTVDLTGATVWTRTFTLNNAGNTFNLAGVTSTSYTVNGANGADIITGGDNGDTLNGGAGNDTLNGEDGDDALNGGAGNDALNGGAGNDVIFGDTGRDAVNGGNGDDRFDITAQAQIVSGETYKGGLGTDRLYLNTVDSIDLSPLTIGTDVEQLVANGSVSLKSSQLGNFNYVYTDDITLTNGGTVDLDDATVWTRTFTLHNAGNTFDLTGVTTTSYTVNGAEGADTITGSENNDTLDGGIGDDTLNGGGGDDTLTGGAGKDTVNGGIGNDRMIITAQSDIVAGESYNGGSGFDKLDIETTSPVDISPLTISSNVEQLESNGTVSLTAAQLDKFVYINTDPITLTKGGTANLSDATVYTNTFDLSAAGNTLNLAGVNDASYTVNGAGGNDSFTGGDFNDLFTGGAGNDVMVASLGADRFDGGAGVDTVNYGAEIDKIGVTLNGSTLVNVSVGGFNEDTIREVENVTGGSANDTLTGDGGANVLSGGNGADTLNGAGGNDTLKGGSGNDILNGNAGNDRLIGDPGRDSLNGGPGFDVFDFNSISESLPGAANRDVILGFVGNGAAAGDSIDVSTIDANVTVAGNQAFAFIGSAAFSAPGQLRYAGGILQGSNDADTSADFEIQLVGSPALVAADIVL